MNTEFDENIIRLLGEFDRLSGGLKQDFWYQNLKPISTKSLLPYFIEFWPKAKKYLRLSLGKYVPPPLGTLFR